MANSYYFPHDFSAFTDSKILFLRQQLGMEGYGIFWVILEQLGLSGGRLPLKIIPVLAMQMQTQEVKVRAVVTEFELFEVDGEGFFNSRLNTHLNRIRKITEGAKLGAEIRWKNAGGIAGGIAPPNAYKEINKINKGNKESIGATSRQTFTPPEKSLVIEYLIKEKNMDEFTAMGLADRWWNFYDSKDWMIGKNKMKKWKSAVNTWLNSPEYKKQTNRWQP